MLIVNLKVSNLCRWTPNHYNVEAICHAIKSQFRGPYYHYDEAHEEVQLKWWIEFMVT